MITYWHGDLFTADVSAFVNPVNTVGVMGKGIALAFKEKYPDNFCAYAGACQLGQVRTGKMYVTEFATRRPRWIINFPTKQHWRYPSQLPWIQEGLEDLRWVLTKYNMDSVAIPALGAGLGGLDWSTVRREMESALAGLTVDIRVYEPLPS